MNVQWKPEEKYIICFKNSWVFPAGKKQARWLVPQLFYSTKGYAKDFSDKIASFGNANIKYNFRSVVLRGKRDTAFLLPSFFNSLFNLLKKKLPRNWVGQVLK